MFFFVGLQWVSGSLIAIPPASRFVQHPGTTTSDVLFLLFWATMNIVVGIALLRRPCWRHTGYLACFSLVYGGALLLTIYVLNWVVVAISAVWVLGAVLVFVAWRHGEIRDQEDL